VQIGAPQGLRQQRHQTTVPVHLQVRPVEARLVEVRPVPEQLVPTDRERAAQAAELVRQAQLNFDPAELALVEQALVEQEWPVWALQAREPVILRLHQLRLRLTARRFQPSRLQRPRFS